MKDFNDVITAIKVCLLNYCSHPEYGDCPYLHDNSCLKNLKSDALYYLEVHKVLSKMWNDKLDEEQNNPPLTWEEFKQMIGKPVWLEKEYNFEMMNEKSKIGQWVVIESISENICGGYYVFFTNNSALDKNDINKTWQAYKKEHYDN